MSSWAVIKSGGKLYKVSEGDVISVEKLETNGSEKINLNSVLLVSSEKGVNLGKPLIAGARVRAKVLGDRKDNKIRVVKFKSKSRYTRVTGHRQIKTQIQIEKIQI